MVVSPYKKEFVEMCITWKFIAIREFKETKNIFGLLSMHFYEGNYKLNAGYRMFSM